MDSASAKFIAFDGSSRTRILEFAREILQEGTRARTSRRGGLPEDGGLSPSRRWTTTASRIREDTDDFPGGRVYLLILHRQRVLLSRYYFFPRPYPLERILYLTQHSRYSLHPSTASCFSFPSLHRHGFINEGGGSREFQYRNKKQKPETTLRARKRDGGSYFRNACSGLHITNQRATFRRYSNIRTDVRGRVRLGVFLRRPMRKVSSCITRNT